MAKAVFCLVLAVITVGVAQARLIPNPDGDSTSLYETSNQPGRLVHSEAYGTSFGSTEMQSDNYQTSFYDQPSRFEQFDSMQEVSTTANSFSDASATETYPDSFSADTSFSTESYVNPAQGASYNYASDSVKTQYEQGLARRGAGVGQAASFALEGNTEKTDSAEWTESSEP